MDKIAKAIIGGVTALAGTLGTALADGQITATEYVAVAAATVVAFFAVWATKNADAS
jgi:hypothetical protein